MFKKILLPCISVMATVICFSQKPNIKPATNPAPKPVLKDLRDSASYAMGIFVINVFRQQGITNINSTIVARAINDLQGNKPQLLNDNAANNAIITYQNKIQAQKSKPTIDAGTKFLAENKKKAGIKTTPSGLQYEILTEGKGPVPVAGDTIICHYVGSYINGKVFESSYNNGKPITHPVTQFIQGWTEALQMMPVGSKWKLYIPYQLAYGPADYNDIPGGSALIFEMELLGIKGKE